MTLRDAIHPPTESCTVTTTMPSEEETLRSHQHALPVIGGEMLGRLCEHKKGKRMKTVRLFSVLAFVLLGALALPAMAGQVNMQFTGLPTGNNYWGVASYPYDISVNGGGNQWMMCIGYNEHIEGGETWQAVVTPVGSLDPSTYLLDYEAAFLFKIAVADGGADGNINAATWFLFEGSPSLTTEAQAWVALAQSQTYAAGEFSDVLLYSAIPGSESGNLGTAQDFLGTTPEPGTLALLGSGMIADGGRSSSPTPQVRASAAKLGLRGAAHLLRPGGLSLLTQRGWSKRRGVLLRFANNWKGYLSILPTQAPMSFEGIVTQSW